MRHDLETDVAATSAVAQRVAGEASPVFRGTLANSIQVQPVLSIDATAGLSITGGIETGAPHAIVMEEGRRPGARMPPLQAIRRWVELKIRRGDMQMPADIGDMSTQLRSDAGPRTRRRRKRSTESRVKGLAFVIARSIARKGIKGRLFMRKAEVAATTDLAARITETTNRWVARLGGGA